MFTNTGTISKFLVSVITAASSSLTVFYGTARWEPAVIAGLGAIGVYLIPNSEKVIV